MSRKEQEEWVPTDHHIYHPAARSSARPSRRGHIKEESILEMLAEEEIAASVQDPPWTPLVKSEDAPTRKRKKESAADIADNKKRRLMKTANKFTDNAREKETLKWHRNCRGLENLHARKFRRLLEGFMWWNEKKSVVPPADALTNDNMKMFFVKCWEDGSRPNVEQGRKWLNHALTKNGQPPLNKWNRQYYHETLDMLKGLSKEVEWREHVPKSTAAFDLIAT